MSKAIEHIYTLYNNPFLLAPIIVRFYEKYNGKQSKDILLSYLILPIVLYEDSKVALIRKDKRRNIRTFINYHKKEDIKKYQPEVKKNNKLFGLPNRITEYNEITNLSLQYAIDRKCLKLNEDMSISFVKYDFPNDNTMNEFLLVSENMALMLKKEKLTHIYIKLGINKL